LCPAGTHRSEFSESLAHCDSCIPGKFSAAGATDCTDCAKGKLTIKGSDFKECLPCPKGTYQDMTGSTECLKCAAGFYGAGGSTTSSCKSKGAVVVKFRPLKLYNTISCFLAGIVGTGRCAPGYWGRLPGQTAKTCEGMCNAGRHARIGDYGDTSAHCVGECEKGKFSEAGAEECSFCQPGRFIAQTKAIGCKLCPNGIGCSCHTSLCSCLRCPCPASPTCEVT
jgi:hypothetical protein